jgi:hypothetical protein
MICVQSSTSVQQPSFNEWMQALHNGLKPRRIFRMPTQKERDVVMDHIKVFMALFDEKTIRQMYMDDCTDVHYINLGLNQIKVRIGTYYDDDPDTVHHGRVYFHCSIAYLDRNGDESQITNEFFNPYIRVYNV